MSEKQFRCKAEVQASYEVPEKEERDIRPQGFKARAENFWYHYKWPTIIVTFLVVVFSITFTQFMLKETPDYIVMTAFDKYMPADVTTALELKLAEYGEDINGDGKVLVEVYDVSTSNHQDIQQSNMTKMMAELQRGEIMLFIVDETYMEKLSELEVFEQNSELFADADGYGTNLRQTELTELINAVQPRYIANDYFVAKRVVKGTSFAENKKSVEHEKNAIEMLNKLTDDLIK